MNKKGNFHLIDEKSSKELLEKLRHHKSTTCPGGSSANTLYGVAILGGNVVSNDGNFFFQYFDLFGG